jgi:hypothetical protein
MPARKAQTKRFAKDAARTVKKEAKSKANKTFAAKSAKHTLSLSVTGLSADNTGTVNGLMAIIEEKDPKKMRASARETLGRLTQKQFTGALTASDKILFAYACTCSNSNLNGYSTLDEKHIAEIQSLLSQIQAYADDTTQLRPLNFLMLASPGAGKSHFIKCVAESLSSRDVSAITFNMASMSSSEDLMRPLDEARNAKVEDKLPLLFLDEFDTTDKHYALLLPLLWDGTLSLGQRDIKVGKIVIVLAGSDPRLPDMLNQAKTMASELPVPEGMSPKLIDLFSRINGSVVRIPPFLAPGEGTDRRTDKVAIASSLLQKRFGKELRYAPLALFRLVVNVNFRYGVRSIAHMIDLIPYKKSVKSLSLDQLALPLGSPAALRKSSLAYHVIDDEDHAHGIVDKWKSASSCKDLIPISTSIDPSRYGSREAVREFMLRTLIAAELESLSSDVSQKNLAKLKKTKKKA